MQKGRWLPSDFGVPQAALEDLKGGDPQTNASILRELLDGKPGAARDIVIANAAAALLVAQRAPDLRGAVALAAESIDSGSASRKLQQIVEFAGTLRNEDV